jgi:predicted phage terminase large subunit-like protein
MMLLKRRRIRTNLTEWARYCGFEPARHHKALIAKLERVLMGECTRLFVAMPPGSAKSTYTSVLFPAFFLANLPEASVISASHTSELAERWGRRVRNSVAEHGSTLGISLRADTQAAGRWELEAGGGYLAVGVGQAVVGYRADLIVIDDPVRGREEAYSEVSRRSLAEWYATELRTRLKPGGRIVMIMTRWHDDDLAGRLLAEAEKGGEQWETLILPAQAEENDPIGRKPGEWLWSDGDYGYADVLAHEQKVQTPMNWSALFQQRPAPESGDYFLSEWLRPYEKPPDVKEMRVYGASDYAVTSKGGDWTVHVIVGVDSGGRLYLLDLWRGQTTPDVWVEHMLNMALKWKPIIAWAEESGQIKSSVGPFLDRRQRERKIPLFRRQFPTKGDKSVRAQSIRGLMALRGLYVPTKAPWYSAFQEELLRFPAGKHDDQVDALGLVGQMIDVLMPGLPPRKDAKASLPQDYLAIEDDAMLQRVARDPDFTVHEIIEDDDGGNNLKLL